MRELSENEKQLGIAWLRAFLSAPHLPPRDDDSGRLWLPMKRFLELAPLLPEDMLPDVFTKLFVAHRSLSNPPEIIDTTLKHFINKHPEIAEQWASKRLANEHWIGTIFSEMSALHELGVAVHTMPVIFSNAKDSRLQIWAPEEPSYGAALFSVKNEPSWKKHLPRILLKLLLDGGKRTHSSRHNHLINSYHQRTKGPDDYAYCAHQVLRALTPFWGEARFLSVLEKILPEAKLKHFEDFAKYIAVTLVNDKPIATGEGKATTLFLINACLDRLGCEVKVPPSEETSYATLAIRLSDTILRAQHVGLPESQSLHQRFHDTLMNAEPNPEAISALLLSAPGANLLRADLSDIWNRHLQDGYGRFSSQAVLKVINEQQKWALLNCMNEHDACDYLIELLRKPELKSKTWLKMVEYFGEVEGLFFAPALKKQLCAHPVIHENLLQMMALAPDNRPNNLRAFSFAGGWGPPAGNPMTALLHSMYPEQRERWLQLECSFYVNPVDFDNFAFTEVYEILRGAKGPTLPEIAAMTQSLGFSMEEFIATLFQQPTAVLSEAEQNITLMDDISYPGY